MFSNFDGIHFLLIFCYLPYSKYYFIYFFLFSLIKLFIYFDIPTFWRHSMGPYVYIGWLSILSFKCLDFNHYNEMVCDCYCHKCQLPTILVTQLFESKELHPGFLFSFARQSTLLCASKPQAVIFHSIYHLCHSQTMSRQSKNSELQ